ncbi:hypothetical protein AN477_11090 [Alicyclobacillus ferrooxydans]|uniref:Uncharacterized protein n=1 Tax=Alicyclobacillus ferrooxydans TaxID=471514 RepID=A0A0P9CVH5_9BACL|nr:hypothetical protein AN477_11090 [Alicyclobacillus ferrooxydans]
MGTFIRLVVYSNITNMTEFDEGVIKAKGVMESFFFVGTWEYRLPKKVKLFFKKPDSGVIVHTRW